MGSCFAEEIYRRLSTAYFRILPSPFGIVFNPLSMAKQWQRLLDNRPYQKDEMIFYDGLFHSFDHHGKYSSVDPNLYNKINEDLSKASLFLTTADLIILTFGSSHYYTHLPSKQIVANCHKVPSNHFELKRASTQLCIDKIFPVMEQQLRLYPNTRFIVTVSPVRYLKYGLVENNRSKASLLLLCEAIEKNFQSAEYFPAFELVADDLKDYRFYKEDMAHPNDIAIEYVWQFFCDRYFTTSTRTIIRDFENLERLKRHRPSSDERALKIHLEKIKNSEEELRMKYLDLFES